MAEVVAGDAGVRGMRVTPLGRAVGWTLAAGMALWPWVVAYMIAYAPEDSGLDFEPPEGVFWLFVLVAVLLVAPAWRAGGHGRRATIPRMRVLWWASCAALWLSALHHLVLGSLALLVLSGQWLLW